MMKEPDKEKRTAVAVIIVAVFFLIFAISFAANSFQKASVRKSCESNNKIYVEKSNSCREKTTSERFEEECVTGLTVDDVHYSCSEIKQANLESAYLSNNIVKHGSSIYEFGTYEEVSAGRNAGDYCLTASESWSHIGETRCVVFHPGWLAYSGRNFFIDEKKNYESGFVVYMYGNYNWNNFYSTYAKDQILVCGQITSYQGHPQIKAVPKNIIVNPTKTEHGSYIVYNYSCK